MGGRSDLEDPPFTCHVDRDGGSATLVLCGDLDVAAAGQLRPMVAELANGVAPAIVSIDLRDVTFLDSSGIQLLVDTERTLGERGTPIELCSVPSSVRRILEIVGLDEHFASSSSA